MICITQWRARIGQWKCRSIGLKTLPLVREESVATTGAEDNFVVNTTDSCSFAYFVVHSDEKGEHLIKIY